MAIDINRVYQKVLALANKEQRGYITPQEFNLFANYAQKDIFEQYFYDLDQRQRATGNELEYSDIISNIEEKIAMFTVVDQDLTQAGGANMTDGSFRVGGLERFYRLGSIRISYDDPFDHFKIVEKVALNEILKYQNSPLAAPSKTNPLYTEFSGLELLSAPAVDLRIRIYPPSDGAEVRVNYVKLPYDPRWTYVISSTGVALYNPTSQTRHFELHHSEETNLVIKILQLAGVAIKDFNLAQVASQEEIKNIQQEKS
tara:strand:+ start:406 stop:1176 length:771 start_codon:yes stop_codon:yes gene_type:complete